MMSGLSARLPSCHALPTSHCPSECTTQPRLFCKVRSAVALLILSLPAPPQSKDIVYTLTQLAPVAFHKEHHHSHHHGSIQHRAAEVDDSPHICFVLP